MTDERLSATPPGVKLGPLSAIPDGGARNYVLQMRAGRFHGFIVRRGEEAWGYVDRCPHMGLPLAQTLDRYLTPGGDLIACSWHAALFAVDTGACVGGPCAGARLTPWPVAVEGGMLVTAEQANPDRSSDDVHTAAAPPHPSGQGLDPSR